MQVVRLPAWLLLAAPTLPDRRLLSTVAARIIGRFRSLPSPDATVVVPDLGDFADVFNDPKLGAQERRARVARGEYAQLWGNGWFMVPNAAYGAWQKGTITDVFPPESRWMPAEN